MQDQCWALSVLNTEMILKGCMNFVSEAEKAKNLVINNLTLENREGRGED